MNQFSNKKLIVLLISVILFVAMIAVSLNHKNEIPIFQQIGNDVTAATGRIFSKPADAATDLFETVNGLLDTYEENQRLKKKINELSETQSRIVVLEEENQKMKEELDLQHTLLDYKSITGAVIARNPDGWLDQIIIDKGSKNGIEVNMSVLSERGLVGRVTEVNPTNAKVQLLTTMNQKTNQISAELVTEDEGTVNGIITSYEEATNRLVMSQITTEQEIKKGDTVITSGLGGITPRALVIGIVDEVSFDRFGLSRQVYIKPAADFSTIRYVTIVVRLAEGDVE